MATSETAIRFNMGERLCPNTEPRCYEAARQAKSWIDKRILTSEIACGLHTEREKVMDEQKLMKCIDKGHDFKKVSIRIWSRYSTLPDMNLRCTCCGYEKTRNATFLEKRAIKVLGFKEDQIVEVK
jgi:hypothetical protein